MDNKTIAVISMGDTGHAGPPSHRKARCYNLFSWLSAKTAEMAERAGVRDVANFDDLVDEAEILLSILPPSSALQLVETR